jgi:hypothetical protein
MNYILKNKLKTPIFKEINKNNLITAQKIPCPVNE